MSLSPWVVHKFGGSSVADAACFERVAAILDAQPTGRLGVVLSACKGVTDALLALVAQAERQDAGYKAGLDALRERHAKIASTLLSAQNAQQYMARFDSDRQDIDGILQAVRLTRSAGRHITDLIAGFGEIWSTRLFREFYASRVQTAKTRSGTVRWLDAREVVVIEWGPLGPAVQWEESRRRMQSAVSADFAGTLIITGFIAVDRRGVQTTLGRNGSDFSGSIFGSLLDAAEIHIWTDVDGVLSADPRRVPDAQVIDSLSYNEAMELAYFGAKVIHPQTMAPAVGREIPIWIRNTFAPDNAATLICAQPKSALAVKGITSIENIALLNLEGAGMIGVPGTASRLFGALREEGISVVLISQGSSEHSICCAVPREQADRAVATVRAAFARELGEGQIQSVEVDRELAILAVVGDGMAGIPGIAAKVFNALGTAAVASSDWSLITIKILQSFANHVGVDYLPNRVIIDCTASGEVAKHYPAWLAAGIHVVTPNKKANSAPMAFYRSLRDARRDGGTHYLYEATVGAGLPVIQTLRDLRETGDEVTSIEGIFSGTLAYLFNVYDGSRSFSEIVVDAKQRGYTEPDPRDDLSGMDVARKLIILGREMGLSLEMSEVQVESLVPAGLEQGSIEEFLTRLPQYDGTMKARFEAARARGKVLRYVGRLTASGTATVGVVEFDAKHAFANIALTDNVVRFATARYNNNPLIVQGPGAGPEVTAGGIFADLLRLSAYLGARL
ncbi:MAG: aspartate kinase [Gammaproteobacteria bacterium]|nr:aspartate kinase [Gammaproteobacteria bacterium]